MANWTEELKNPIDFLLQENDDFLLLEDDGQIILEQTGSGASLWSFETKN